MISFEKIPYLLEENGKRLAIAKAEWEYLEEMRKVILAAEANNAIGTEAARDRIARTSEAYKNHLKGTKEARQEQLTLQATQEALQARFEWYRTQNANRRVEMGLN